MTISRLNDGKVVYDMLRKKLEIAISIISRFVPDSEQGGI